MMPSTCEALASISRTTAATNNNNKTSVPWAHWRVSSSPPPAASSHSKHLGYSQVIVAYNGLKPLSGWRNFLVLWVVCSFLHRVWCEFRFPGLHLGDITFCLGDLRQNNFSKFHFYLCKMEIQRSGWGLISHGKGLPIARSQLFSHRALLTGAIPDTCGVALSSLLVPRATSSGPQLSSHFLNL